ncbi:hypothetical protein BH23BAC1_BH23BAC1_46820 [soil metagenome]
MQNLKNYLSTGYSVSVFLLIIKANLIKIMHMIISAINMVMFV